MNNSELINTLKKLSTREKTRFKQWLMAEFVNRHPILVQFGQYLLSLDLDKNSNKLEKRTIYKVLFPKENFNALKLNNFTSDLLHLLHQFLAYQSHDSSPFEQQLKLIQTLLQKGLRKPFQRVIRKWKKKRNKSTIQNHQFFFEEYQIYEQQDQFFLSKPSRSYDENLQLKSDNLDIFYFATKLRIACDMTSRNTIIQANYHCDFLEELTIYYQKYYTRFENIPAITIYYQILKMLNQPEDESNYQALKVALSHNVATFPKAELQTLYVYMRNYCTKQINKGKLEYYRELLELYQFLLEQKIIFDNNYLMQWDYKNIVTVSVRLKEFDWIEQFIHDYKKHLPPTERENAYVYNLAVFYYATQQYKAALQLIYNVKFVDVTYYVGVKTIQLKSYFELNESDAFYALIDTFSIYIRRNRQLSEYRKKASFNFLKTTKKIYALKEQSVVLSKTILQQRQKALQLTLEQSNPITNKDWLMQVLNEI